MFDKLMILIGVVLLIASNAIIFINGNPGPVELFILSISSFLIGGVIKEIKDKCSITKKNE